MRAMAIRPIHEALNGETRFGRLTVVGEGEPKQYRDKRHRRAIARCDCGTEKLVAFTELLKGTTASCGCLKNEMCADLGRASKTHGEGGLGHRTAEYKIWVSMKARCNNPRHIYFNNYGGRGIKVCERWQASFENFLADIGRRPSAELSLDRIDNDRGYEPGNVRWADRATQARNSRRRTR